MMEINDDKNSGYLFANCNVYWKIENFCLAHPLSEYSLLSPEFMFQGLKSVYWRMSLKLQSEKSPENRDGETSPENVSVDVLTEKIDSDISPQNALASVYLERLPTSLTKEVFVNWEISVRIGSKKFGTYERKVDFGDRIFQDHIDIATTNDMLNTLLLSQHDTINICCYFIAYEKQKVFNAEYEKPPGTFHLYQDLRHLKDEDENYSDIKLKVKDQYIRAHKIILSCNERFDIYIKQAVTDIVEISDFDYKTLDAFVNFLYTGDLYFCFFNISISLMRCLDHFNCDVLKPYYFPEELPLSSKIQTMKREFRWYVPDILDKYEFEITSPPIKFLDSNSTWHLTVSMKADDPNKFFSIFAKITAGDKPKNFCLEFALVNESEREYFFRRLVRHNECYENLGFDEFVKKQDIRDQRWVTIGDCVGFLFRIRTSNCTQESSIGCHSMRFILRRKSNSYKQIIEKLLHFYKKEIYCDITIITKNDVYKANKFILAAFSPGIRQLIENNRDGSLILGTPDYLMRIILKYMYSGVLEEKGERIKELSEVASPENLHIPSLYEECQKYLREINTCYNVKRKY